MINKPQIAVLDYKSATNKQRILDIVQFTIESGPPSASLIISPGIVDYGTGGNCRNAISNYFIRVAFQQ